MEITIHANPFIEWQKIRANNFCIGLKRLGFEVELTRSQTRISDAPAVLLGTTCWREIERAPGDWLLVDRASYGDPDYVSLVWNGHGQRGDHKVPENWDGSRWAKHKIPIRPTRMDGSKIVLCGQTETYTPLWESVDDWYAAHPECTHFRPHPAGQKDPHLPVWKRWDDVAECVTLNSSVAIDAVANGVPHVVVDDEGGMAYFWMNHPSRQHFFEWLAWTQWHWDEIRDGEPIRHLFDG